VELGSAFVTSRPLTLTWKGVFRSASRERHACSSFKALWCSLSSRSTKTETVKCKQFSDMNSPSSIPGNWASKMFFWKWFGSVFFGGLWIDLYLKLNITILNIRIVQSYGQKVGGPHLSHGGDKMADLTQCSDHMTTLLGPYNHVSRFIHQTWNADLGVG